MSPLSNKGVRDTQRGTDPEDRVAFVEALLAVHQELDLTAQLAALLEPSTRWCGAECGFALGPAPDRPVLQCVASTVPVDDPRRRAVGKVPPARVGEWLAEGTRTFKGLGPFEAIAHQWPGRAPGWCLAVPVQGPRDELVGTLLLMAAQAPTQQDIDRVVELVGRARTALGHALQLRSMRELVIKDDTASCFNRRHFEEFLPEELARASRFRSPVSLIFLDMDNLKEVNNRFGHSMGSRSLYEVSVRVRSKIRKFDKLFRFGGDEFCIVLPETEWHGAVEVAQRVREVIAGTPFLADGPERPGVRMTASLGIASYPLHARSQQDLVQLADRAMQKIKRTSKNGIGIAEIAGGDEDET